MDLAVYDHPRHHWNVDRMLDAMAAALDYYQTRFGPYQHDHFRVIECPGYRGYAEAFAGTIAFSESVGFTGDYTEKDSYDFVTGMTVHAAPEEAARVLRDGAAEMRRHVVRDGEAAQRNESRASLCERTEGEEEDRERADHATIIARSPQLLFSSVAFVDRVPRGVAAISNPFASISPPFKTISSPFETISNPFERVLSPLKESCEPLRAGFNPLAIDFEPLRKRFDTPRNRSRTVCNDWIHSHLRRNSRNLKIPVDVACSPVVDFRTSSRPRLSHAGITERRDVEPGPQGSLVLPEASVTRRKALSPVAIHVE